MTLPVKLQTLITTLEEAGFKKGSSLVYSLFDGDDTPEHGTLSWRDNPSELFNSILIAHDYSHVESEGGGEGEGEYCYGVIKVGEEYYKADWSYYSYDGCEYDGIESTVRVVTPKEKTIVVYE
jgi:hypothetical protein